MPQTRFVLRKSLALNKKVIVVVNKIDRDAARQVMPWLNNVLLSHFASNWQLYLHLHIIARSVHHLRLCLHTLHI